MTEPSPAAAAPNDLAETPPDRPWWERDPPGPATAAGMVRRAREEGRVLRPEIYALAGLPADPQPAPAHSAAESAGPVEAAADLPVSAPSAGRGWIPASHDLGLPSDRAPGEGPGAAGPFAAIASGAKFTVEHRVRFLDHLAFAGNARAAARRVAVSPETAYRARRQDPAFAALWDAALVHARHYAESALATRALDGFEVEVWHRGELVGHQVRHDTRLLLAHLGRLDRRVERDAAACARAERFDALLADYAGHPAPEGFADAAAEAHPATALSAAPELPPTRAEYRRWCQGQVTEAIVEADAAARVGGEGDPDAGEGDRDAGGGDPETAEIEILAEVADEADSEYDDWHEGALACVAAIVEAPGEPPVEVKSMPVRGPRESVTLNRVTPVNPSPRARGETALRLEHGAGRRRGRARAASPPGATPSRLRANPSGAAAAPRDARQTLVRTLLCCPLPD